jgi:transcriptional regulator NrdR family protein
MKCFSCDHPTTKVLDTRVFDANPRWIKRRRKCLECGHILFTLEMPTEDLEIQEPEDAYTISTDEHDEPS